MKKELGFTKCDECGNTSIDLYPKAENIPPQKYLTMSERANQLQHSLDGNATYEIIHSFVLRCRNCGFEVEYLQY